MTPFRSAAKRKQQRKLGNERTGSVLLLVLVVVAILTLGTNTYLDLMQSEHRAVRRHGRAMNSQKLAETGVEYLKTFVSKTPAAIYSLGGLSSNATAMKALLADNQEDPFARGRFTIVSPAQTAGIYTGYRYGLENESAKLNLHVLLAEGVDGDAQYRLMALPGMTPDVADAILDWLDADAVPRPYGAEADYYLGLDPPYAPRNGQLASLDELPMVRGVTPELLYGVDQNRNYVVDANETPRGKMLEIDNADGQMNRGWAAYLTIASVELMGGSPTAPLVDLNSGDLQTLYNSLKTTLTDEQAKFIVLYRQYGAAQGQQGQNGQNGGDPTGGQGGDSTRNRTTGGRPTTDGGSAGGETVPAASIELNFQQQGATRINSPLDLIGVQVQVTATPPGGQGGDQNGGSSDGGSQDGNEDDGNDEDDNNNGGESSGGTQGPGGEQQQPPPKTVTSPWQDNVSGYRDLLKLYDVASTLNQGRIAGRVNVNLAARPVLMSIPQLPPAIVDQIIATRELEPSPTLSNQRHALWLLTEGVVQLDMMRQLERFITVRGDAFSGQSIGFYDADSMPVRGEFILDRSVSPVRLRAWRDLSNWGPGFSATALGALGDGT
jgi:hypothetical protein